MLFVLLDPDVLYLSSTVSFVKGTKAESSLLCNTLRLLDEVFT
jgi:hypothetical protein